MTNKDIEKEFCKDLTTYAKVAINDDRTDGDRIIANMLAALIYGGMINKDRFNNFLKDGLEILGERR